MKTGNRIFLTIILAIFYGVVISVTMVFFGFETAVISGIVMILINQHLPSNK
jgi:hypothetical protein